MGARGDGHSSRTPVARRLLRPTRAAHLETRLAVLTPPRRPYSVLLPVGFAVPALLPGPRCALTAPFHPYPPKPPRRRAVCFLWHCPWGRPRRRLSGTVLPRSPDFPPRPPIRWQLAERPSGLLTKLIRGLGAAASSWPEDHAGQALNGGTGYASIPQSIGDVERVVVEGVARHLGSTRRLPAPAPCASSRP